MQTHSADPFGIVGQILDSQFRVDRLVGEGGFSAVYRGHHIGLDEPIAIKCLKLPPTLPGPLVDQFVKRFRDESRILYRLSQGNLNIVRSIAAGTTQAANGMVVPYMVLEWLEGRSLANDFTIRRTVGHSGRPLEEVVKLFGSAAEGLGYAHSQGVVHRDLNPGNLFLTQTAQGVRMKVLDFGVAKIVDDSAINIAQKQTVGQIRIFAPAYGAPEQFDDSIGKVGAASDVYAFALILLEALRDRCVNEGQHLGDFAKRAIDPSLRPTPRALGLNVTDEVEQAFVRATRFDPRERFQSAGELWQALAIAVHAAAQQRHVQAAMETPSLAMPTQPDRNTRKGMAPPGSPGPGPAIRKLDKTVPLGTGRPNIPALADQLAAARNAPQARPPVGRPIEADEDELPTRIGAPPQIAPTPQLSEPEDEVTRVAQPEADVLRGLAGPTSAGAPPGRHAVTMAQGSHAHPQMSAPSPRPAAGAPPPAAPPSNPSSGRTGLPDVSDGEPDNAGSTLMMSPGGFGSLPKTPPQLIDDVSPPPAPAPPTPRGGNLAMTMPLTGQNPLGQPRHPTPGGQGMPAMQGMPGMPGMQGMQGMQPPPSSSNPQSSQHSFPHQQPQPPHPMMPPTQMSHAGPFPTGPQPATQMSHAGPFPAGPQHAVSMHDGMVPPKKSNTVLFVAIGLGVMALIGTTLALIVAFSPGKSSDTTSASATAPPASAPASIVASAPPVPPPAPEPAAAATAAADASVAANIEEEPAADAGAQAAPAPTPAETAAAPAPAPAPVPVPTAVVVKDAGPPPDPNAWNEAAARSRLSQANGILAFCKKADGVTGPGTASVTFNNDGTVSSVAMDPPYAGTPAGDCVSGHFKRTKVNPFTGSPHTVKHSFDVPK